MILGLFFVMVSKLFAIVPAIVIRHIINYVAEAYTSYKTLTGTERIEYFDGFINQITLLGLLILGMAILSGVFLYFQRQTLIGASRLIEFDLKNEIYTHYQTLPLSFYRKNNTGDLMARISEDVSNVRMYLGPAIMYGLDLVMIFLITVPIMVSVNLKLTLLVLIPLPFLALSIYFIENIINRRSSQIQKELSNLSTYVQESFSGLRVIKSFVREKDISEGFHTGSNVYREKSLRLAKVNAFFFPLILSLIGLSVIIVIYVGGREVIAGNIEPGHIAEFIIYINRLTWPVAALGWTTSLVQKAEASQARINEFLNTKNDIVSEKNLDKEISGNIEFKDVTLTYPDTGIIAVKNLSFTIREGQSVGIIGPTGSGKSTIANLLVRLYDPTGGSIFVGGNDLKDFNLFKYRNQVGYVPQDVFLFSDSIRNNIGFGALDIKEEDMLQAAKDADLYKNIIDFPEKFDTILGERGITLSGGQKQRLSIARALARSPKLLILDDCLSAVDTNTEHTILNNLKRIMAGRTTVVISHRVSSVKLADQILVLEQGEIAEQGSHEELMKRNGIYKSLYDKQLEEEKQELNN
ncbi:MAG: ABC transporter ATP-binding protein [Cytophagaceae bacterium]